jgi:hypothetical protein
MEYPWSMAGETDEMELKFTKSRAGRKTENAGLALLRQDPRFRVVDLATKRRIVAALPVSGEWGAQTFDALMCPPKTPPLHSENVHEHLDVLRLVEMKTTQKRIRNSTLNGFFFGATEREYAMAKALGDRYLFAFVVLNSENDYGRPFFVLLTLEQVEARTRVRRVQFQVNLRSDLLENPDTLPLEGFGPFRP